MPMQPRGSMFFIPPAHRLHPDASMALSNEEATLRSLKRKHDVHSSTKDTTAERRLKRNQRACDRCRLRKIRCSGGTSCEKCTQDGVLCTAGERRPNNCDKPMSKAYVHMVESQRDLLITALRDLEDGGSRKPDIDAILEALRLPQVTDEVSDGPCAKLPEESNGKCDTFPVSSTLPTLGSEQNLTDTLSDDLADAQNWLDFWEDEQLQLSGNKFLIFNENEGCSSVVEQGPSAGFAALSNTSLNTQATQPDCSTPRNEEAIIGPYGWDNTFDPTAVAANSSLAPNFRSTTAFEDLWPQ